MSYRLNGTEIIELKIMDTKKKRVACRVRLAKRGDKVEVLHGTAYAGTLSLPELKTFMDRINKIWFE